MTVFTKMASMASSRLLGASAERRISNEQLAEQMAEMALNDPELAAHHCARLAAAAPALQAQRAHEDAEWSIESPRRDPSGRIAATKQRDAGETTPKAKAAPR